MAVRRPHDIMLLRARLATLARWLPAAARGTPRAVHQARVATRRLRELLPLVSVRHRRRLLEAARRITRALGPVRELDVAIANLDEFAADGALSRAALACLLPALTAERRAQARRMQRRLARVDAARLRAQAVAPAARTRDVGLESPPQVVARAAARQRAARRAAALRLAIGEAGALYLPDRLHEVRIATKKLRYASEVTHELGRSRGGPQLRTLREGQRLLGRMHDLDLLASRVRALQGTVHTTSLRTSAELDALVRRLEQECRLLQAEYVHLRPALLAICARAERVTRTHAARR